LPATRDYSGQPGNTVCAGLAVNRFVERQMSNSAIHFSRLLVALGAESAR
jgi:hypothetical protein